MMTSQYHLKALAQRYLGRTVLHLDELEIHSGEVLALVGPSGAGKSTLLRLLAFLEQPAGGQIVFQGRAADADWPDLEARRKVTLVFQRPQLLSRSVYDNVLYGLELREGRLGKDDPRVLAMLARLGVASLKDAPAGTLSGGEMQRVALARALVLEPDVLLLDEPTANLDPGNISRIEEMIRSVRTESKTTVIIVTHNIFQAKRVADRMALLLDGKLAEVGLVEEMFVKPNRPETAAFIQGDIIY